jgi:RNA polymerase sigma factor (TIGR02999 family)
LGTLFPRRDSNRAALVRFAPMPPRVPEGQPVAPDDDPAEAGVPRQVTLLLDRINSGDRQALDELLPLVYGELHAMAARFFVGAGAGQTLQATALVNEAYVKLLGSTGNRKAWAGRGHFFAVAATAMRRVLTDYSRRAGAAKRGGGAARITLGQLDEDTQHRPDHDLLDLHDALEELERSNERIARVVELRFLSGMTVEEVAVELGLSDDSVYKDWRAGRAFLKRRLAPAPGE